jgi:hypothetical protein
MGRVSIQRDVACIRCVARVEAGALVCVFSAAPSSSGARAMPSRRISAQEERLLARAAEQVVPGRGSTVFIVTHRRRIDRANPLQNFGWSAISGSVQH